ncbi:MAG: hypothetical protein JST92_18640 [Deltaproteobacteria bacterium]|nr:hypothetical protein [Deltaproteobacteria bacterium]
MTRVAPLLCLSFLMMSCATLGVPGAPETIVQVLDEAGKPIAGTFEFYSRVATDQCEADDSGCGVHLSAGYYSLTFRKVRAARMSSGIGGTTGGDRYSGCLRERINLVPGKKIVCKKTQEYNCGRGIFDNMDCGEFNSQRYGYKPVPGQDVTEQKAE